MVVLTVSHEYDDGYIIISMKTHFSLQMLSYSLVENQVKRY